jgi:hypothetical protein
MPRLLIGNKWRKRSSKGHWMSKEVLFLDVNVPMYAAGKEHPYKASCVWLMTEIVERHIAVAIDTQGLLCLADDGDRRKAHRCGH